MVNSIHVINGEMSINTPLLLLLLLEYHYSLSIINLIIITPLIQTS